LTINGLEVKVDSLFDDEGVENDFAILIVGSNAVKSYDNGDGYIGEDEDDPDWVWVLGELTTVAKGDSTVGSGGPTIGLKNDFARDGYNDDPAAVGEAYTLPGGFIDVSFDSFTVPDAEYMTFTLEFDTNIDLDTADDDSRAWGTSEDGVVLTANVDETLVLDFDGAWAVKSGNFTADVNTKVIYLLPYFGNATSDAMEVEVFYVDDENNELFAGDVQLHASTVQSWGFIDYKETTGAGDLELGFTGANTTVNDGSVSLWVQEELDIGVDNYDLKALMNVTDGAFTHLGVAADESEAAELTYTDGTTTHQLGTKDENHRSYYGFVIEDPDSNGASDKVVLEIPADVVEGTIIVSGTGTTSTSGTGDVRKVVPVSTAVGKLDTEISDAATVGKDLVLVGGPAVNKWTASALGYDFPTYGADLTQITEGEGYIEYLDGVFTSGQDVVVAFGWEADNTRDATTVLLQVDSFLAELEGNMAVKVTDVSSAGITAV
jgi:hypothetical protein